MRLQSQSELQMKMKIEMEMEMEMMKLKLEMATICSTAQPAGHLTCNKTTQKRNETQQQQNFCASCDNGNEISSQRKGMGSCTQKRKKVGSLEEGRGNFKLTL